MLRTSNRRLLAVAGVMFVFGMTLMLINVGRSAGAVIAMAGLGLMMHAA